MTSDVGTLWLLTDQTTTAGVYRAFLRAFIPGRFPIQLVSFPRLDHRQQGTENKIDAAVDKACARLKDLDPSRDRLLVVHDWEDDLHVEANRQRKGEMIRRIAQRCQHCTGIPDECVKVWFVPPTTEGVYLLFAYEGLDEVRLVLERQVAGRPPQGVSLDHLIASRGRYGANPTVGPHVAPRKADVDRALGVRHSLAKSRLARHVEGALDNHAPSLGFAPKAACLKGVRRWLGRWTATTS